MRVELRRIVREFTAIVLFIGLALMKQNGQDAVVMVLYILILVIVAWGINLLIQTKSFWQNFGYHFTTAEVMGIEVLQKYSGQPVFFIKPGASEYKLLAISLRYVNEENNELNTVANIWQKSWFRYLADIEIDHYQSRIPNYQIGDAIEIMINDNNHASVQIW